MLIIFTFKLSSTCLYGIYYFSITKNLIFSTQTIDLTFLDFGSIHNLQVMSSLDIKEIILKIQS